LGSAGQNQGKIPIYTTVGSLHFYFCRGILRDLEEDSSVCGLDVYFPPSGELR
jgi:hypothetical protein